MEVLDIIAIENSKIYTSIVLVILIAIIFRTPTAIADIDTTLHINPPNQTVSFEETFSVEVYCSPGQSIKSFELKLSFDPSLLEANSVEEGDIFNGYPTFFSSGTIDNTAGVIDDIYNLIVNSNDVSDPGTLVTISFTSKMSGGTSILNLLNVGITNDTGYVPLLVNDGNITIQGENNNPNIPSNPSGPTAREIGQSGIFSTSATDPEGDQVQYRFDWNADGGNEYSSWTVLGTSGHTDSLSHSWNNAGTYVVKAQARDEHGNESSWSSDLTVVITESSGGDGDGGGEGSPPSSGDDNNDTSEQNNPPETPVKPSGPTFIEIDVEYTYSSSTYDVDGDQIRYRFDWGDGNYSNWSDFMFSNTSVSMSHLWSVISNYNVRVMAQDENGMNSSWSPVLNVTASQAEFGEIPPVADVNVSSNISVNQTIVFDAIDSFDPDGIIVSYMWDFGDGETGSGVSPEHSYKKPGRYNVTLVLTDNNGNIYSKTITVNVASVVVDEQSKEKRDLLLFQFGTVIIWSMVAIICVFAMFFIKRLFFPNLHIDMSHYIHGIEKSESKIEKTKISENAYPKWAVSIKITDDIDVKRASVVKMGDYYDKMQENYIKSNYKDELSFKESILQERPGSVKLSAEDSVFPKVGNIDPIVNNPILSNIENKLPVEKDDVFNESIDNIRRKVDEILTSKE